MKWRCQTCGYIHDGDEAPEKCPKCGAPKDKFVQLAEKEAELVERSRLTNSLHVELLGLLAQVQDLAESGIEDNLDPGCLAIFKKAQQAAVELSQSVKAEIQAHINKGKWG